MRNNQWSDEDSSFQCPSLPASSYSPTSLNSSSYESQLSSSSHDSSNPHISAFETREDSFLENMYQFVRECLNNKGLMQRLHPPKRHDLEDDNLIENNLISMKYIKKPRSEPQIKQINNWHTIFIEFLNINKLKLILIMICVAMIAFRVQDLYQQQLESRRQGCLKQYKMDNIEDLKLCVQNAHHLITEISFLRRMRLMFWDVHQFFYMGVILCASYHALRSGVGLFQNARISYEEYYDSYKKIHKIDGQKKITLAELKEQFINKRILQNEMGISIEQQEQRNNMINDSQRSTNQSNEVKIQGMKINFGLLSPKDKKHQHK